MRPPPSPESRVSHSLLRLDASRRRPSLCQPRCRSRAGKQKLIFLPLLSPPSHSSSSRPELLAAGRAAKSRRPAHGRRERERQTDRQRRPAHKSLMSAHVVMGTAPNESGSSCEDKDNNTCPPACSLSRRVLIPFSPFFLTLIRIRPSLRAPAACRSCCRRRRRRAHCLQRTRGCD